MRSQSYDFTLCKPAIIFGDAGKHMRKKITDSLDSLHVPKKEFQRWKQLRDAV
jgi:hypothetical protein